jgi:hypothetical protein
MSQNKWKQNSSAVNQKSRNLEPTFSMRVSAIEQDGWFFIDFNFRQF